MFVYMTMYVRVNVFMYFDLIHARLQVIYLYGVKFGFYHSFKVCALENGVNITKRPLNYIRVWPDPDVPFT